MSRIAKERTGQHGSACPSTFTALVHTAQASKKILFVHTSLLCLAQLVGKDVEHELTVTVSVDVTVRLQIQISLQLRRVNEVSVVSEADTVRAVHVKGLSLRIRTATSSRVPQMADTHRARQVGNFGAILKDLGSHAVGFELVNSTPGRTGRDAGCILATIYVTQQT